MFLLSLLGNLLGDGKGNRNHKKQCEDVDVAVAAGHTGVSHPTDQAPDQPQKLKVEHSEPRKAE